LSVNNNLIGRGGGGVKQAECNGEQLSFQGVGGRQIVARFDGGQLSSDGGGLLLREVERRTGLLRQFAACFRDFRNPLLVEHTLKSLISQRVMGLALGYEDLNDHDQLRHDPLLAVLSGKLAARRSDCAPVAGKSTLNRLELSRELPASITGSARDCQEFRARAGVIGAKEPDDAATQRASYP